MNQVIIEKAPTTAANDISAFIGGYKTTGTAPVEVLTARDLSPAHAIDRSLTIEEIISIDPLAGLKDAAFASVKDIETKKTKNENITSRGRNERARGATVLLTAGALAVAGFFGNFINNQSNTPETPAADISDAQAVVYPNPVGPTEDCPTSWVRQEIDSSDTHRVIPFGVPELGEARTSGESKAAAYLWLNTVRGDNELFRGAATIFTQSPVNLTNAELSNGQCASDDAAALYDRVQRAYEHATFLPDNPTPDMVNMGVDENGNLVIANTAGLSGDLEGITIVLEDGTRIGLLARCGNPVTEGEIPGIPEGPTDTDEPEPTPPTTVPPTTVPPTTVPPTTVPPTTVPPTTVPPTTVPPTTVPPTTVPPRPEQPPIEDPTSPIPGPGAGGDADVNNDPTDDPVWTEEPVVEDPAGQEVPVVQEPPENPPTSDDTGNSNGIAG